MALFKRGFEAARENKKKQEERAMSGGLFRLFISDDGGEANIHFLTEEPVNFEEHTIKTNHGGKERYDNHICTGENCKYCAEGDRPSFKGAFLVWDEAEFEVKDDKAKSGKRKVHGSVKLYVGGTKILSQLDRLSNKYGLTSRDLTLVRIGKGTSTSYTFELGDKHELDEDEIRDMLPDNLKKLYDGTEDSLYSIIEKQLTPLGSDDDNDTDEDEYDEDEDDNLISYDDEEEDEDEKPKKKAGSASSKKKSSVKSLFKKK